jgi:glyoxylase-like metal-dependent hydrolase (beta-lactamase superfamily II)
MKEGLVLHQLVLGPFVNNIYILGDERTREAIVIDASFQAEKIVEAVKKLGLQVKSVLLTHGHIDHIAGAGVLKNGLGAEIVIHQGDAWMYEHVGEQGKMFGFGVSDLPAPDRFIKDGEEIRFGSHALKIVETPGHSPGSVCLRGELDGRPVAFTGDTLFCGSIGRTDLWGGDYGEIIRSIKKKLLVLPEETLVLPGHGDESDVHTEKKTNPFVGEGAEA